MNGFFRVRFLASVGRLINPRKTLKYAQPPNSEPRAYFPPYVDWSAIAKDTKRSVVITEGEKKAAKATKEGVPTIGLGGIWNFRTARFGKELIADIDSVDWHERSALIIFDSDPKPKPEIDGAAETLGRALESRGALVGRVTLPLLGAEKVGLDDYLVSHSAAELRALPVSKLHATATLEAFNAEVAVIHDPPGIISLGSKRIHRSPDTLVRIAYANRIMSKLTAAGALQPVNAFREWLEWPRRRTHTTVVYEPGAPLVTSENAVNLWSGWGIEPAKGSVAPFEKLLDYMFHGADAEREWFVKWLAYPLQHPGAKLYAAAVLWSRDTGTGKTLVGMSMRKIYGENWAIVGEDHLHSQFNEWQAHKQFVLGEEVTGSDRRAEADRLKRLITSEVVRVNRKFEAAYEIRDCGNFLFTTNHPDAFLLDEKDRRFFVHEVATGGAEKPPERWFTVDYDAWYKSDAGAAALFAYLLDVSLKGFDPRARAPVTKAREDMVALGGGEADAIAEELLAAPDLMLRIGDAPVARDLYTYRQLAQLLANDGREIVGAKALARALGRRGIKSSVLRVGKGTVRVVAVRDHERWDRASHADKVAHFTGERQREEKF